MLVRRTKWKPMTLPTIVRIPNYTLVNVCLHLCLRHGVSFLKNFLRSSCSNKTLEFIPGPCIDTLCFDWHCLTVVYIEFMRHFVNSLARSSSQIIRVQSYQYKRERFSSSSAVGIHSRLAYQINLWIQTGWNQNLFRKWINQCCVLLRKMKIYEFICCAAISVDLLVSAWYWWHGVLWDEQ